MAWELSAAKREQQNKIRLTVRLSFVLKEDGGSIVDTYEHVESNLIAATDAMIANMVNGLLQQLTWATEAKVGDVKLSDIEAARPTAPTGPTPEEIAAAEKRVAILRDLAVLKAESLGVPTDAQAVQDAKARLVIEDPQLVQALAR